MKPKLEVGIENLDKVGSDVLAGQSSLPDDLAKQESKKFSGDAKRSEETKQAFHWGFIWFIRISAVMVTVIFAARMMHFVLPSTWKWLADDQIKGMDEFLFHGTVGGILVAYIQKALPASKSE